MKKINLPFNVIQFLKKGVVFVLLLFLIDLLTGYILSKLLHSDYDRLSYGIERSQEEIVVVGSSRAYRHYIPAILTDSTGLSCYNFGRDGSPYCYGAVMIRTILDRYTPSLIVWDIDQAEMLMSRESLSCFLPYWDNKSVSKAVEEYYPAIRPMTWTNQTRYNSLLFTFLERRMGLFRQERQNNGYMPDHKISRPFKTKLYAPPAMDQEMKQTLSEVIASCRNKGVKILFVSSPRFCSFAENVRIEGELADFLSQEQVTYLCLTNDSTFKNHSEWIRDESHLNHQGAIQLSQKVASTIRKMELE